MLKPVTGKVAVRNVGKSTLCLVALMFVAPNLRAETSGTTSISAPATSTSVASTTTGLTVDQLDPLTTAASVQLQADEPPLSRFQSAEYAPATSATRIVELPDLAAFERSLTARKRRQVSIGPEAVIARTISKNLNIRRSELERQKSADEIRAQQGIFDLSIRGLAQAVRSEAVTLFRPNSAVADFLGPNVSSTDQLQAELGLDQLLPTGGTVSLTARDTREETNRNPNLVNPFYTTNLNLTVRQPLMRGAGSFVTKSKITIAQLDERVSAAALRSQLLLEVSTSLQAYYDLIFAVTNVDVLRVALDQAQELLRVNTAKYNAGVLPELDVLQAQADVASRQQDVIVALQEVENASDRLRTLMAEIGDADDTTLRPREKPNVPDFAVNEKAFIATALEHRPELEAGNLEIEKQGVTVDVARNSTLPKVDAFGGVGRTGVTATNRTPILDYGDAEGNSWNLGVEFSYPLQNRSALARLNQSQKQLDSTVLRRAAVKNEILLAVRNAVRAVETNRQKVAVGRATVEFNRAKVDSGQKRQQVGLATSYDVLLFQRDLANARSQLLRSVVDYNKSIITIEEAKGTLLERVGVEVKDSSRRSAAVPKSSKSEAPKK